VDDNNIIILKEIFTIDFLKEIILSTEIDSLKYACNNLNIFDETEKELLNFKIELFSYYFKEESLITKGNPKVLSNDFTIWLHTNSTKLFELYQNDSNNKNEILSIIRIILNITFSYNLIELENKLRLKLKEIQK
jgi:hypothetical protein